MTGKQLLEKLQQLSKKDLNKEVVIYDSMNTRAYLLDNELFIEEDDITICGTETD